MKRVKYLENNRPIIYIIATPIGNLTEINQRMIETLNKVSIILCEDTRVTTKIINHLQLKNKHLISYHRHNEYHKLKETIELVKEHHEVALVSDAGYPLLSDPGLFLVHEAIINDINIVVINGSNALIPALINSGMPSIPFTFIGFIPEKKNEAIKYLKTFDNYHHTLIMYESIYNLNKTLNHILEVFGNVDVSISREITKLNEEHIYGNVNELLNADLQLKGELVICINNTQTINQEDIINDELILAMVNELIDNNSSRKDAIKIVSKKLGIEKNYVYDLVHR
ncbi:MAG: 16S rRNA (cytidine(1402)-2'-O)-methyltransferase [Bacilli bacterium]|jgi:16S rRNA (cytidine1402-2'-O)-methyltransferase|nr:16S rRNA (cytidine(1402)-2'-O)-methyltransferase [Bacilli bacterium]